MKLIAMISGVVLLAIGTVGASAAAASGLHVGHTVEAVVVEGSAPALDPRQVDVHLWYPADHKRLSKYDRSSYTSILNDVDLPDPWTPLSWTIAAEVAREGAPIDRHGKRFPVIVFSHGSQNEPIDYAHTLELIAGAGFVVAAPSHVNNSQDDVRIDHANTQTGAGLPCRDGLAGPCSRTNVPVSIADRVRDISAVLEQLPSWLGNRADVKRVGVMGHSRGTVSALAASGGGAQSAFEPVEGVKAVMGMAIGVQAVTNVANLPGVTAPTLLVAGALDATSPQTVSDYAFDRIQSRVKAFVSITNGVHRTFDSTYCDQVHAAGSIAQANENAILDLHTARGILVHPTSGVATQYCSPGTFTGIGELVEDVTGAPVPDNVPTTGLETDEVKLGMTRLATAFFGTFLNRPGRAHFVRHLTPKWLEKHMPMVGCAQLAVSGEEIFPPCPPTPG